MGLALLYLAPSPARETWRGIRPALAEIEQRLLTNFNCIKVEII